MTDLEAKISSEFANGDPTVQGASIPKQPLAMRISFKRIAPVVAAVLIIGGGIITYFASTSNKVEAPGITPVKPAAVQSAATTAPNTTPSTDTLASGKSAAKVTTSKATKPATAATTPTPEPVRPYYPPTHPTGTTVVNDVTDLVQHVVRTVEQVVTATVSIAL